MSMLFLCLFDTDNLEVMSMLLRAGAYLEATDLHFGTPLHVAAYKGHAASARLLLRAGKFSLCTVLPILTGPSK